MNNWFFGKKKKLTDRWPKDETGQPVRPVYLIHRGDTDMETDLTVNLLEAYGIPVMTRYPNDGSFGKGILGTSGGGGDLYVPETMLEGAQDLLRSEPVEEEEP